MVKFQDGPAASKSLMLGRSPLFLRVTVGLSGELDALDQLADRPHKDESIFAYQRVGESGRLHVLGTRNGRRFGQWYSTATYRLCETQPDDVVLRDTGRWRVWCEEQMKAVANGC